MKFKLKKKKISAARDASMRLKKFDVPEMKVNYARIKAAGFVVFLCFVTLIARLWYLQVLEWQNLRSRSETNRFRQVRLVPPRGKILDRNGRVLAGMRPTFNLCLIRGEAKDLESLFKKLSQLLDIPETSLKIRFIKGKSLPKYMPVVLKRDINWEQLSKVEVRLHKLPGVYIEAAPGRKYPEGKLAAHLIGHLGQITEQDLVKDRYPGAVAGDLVGKYGVEAKYDKILRGVYGSRKIEVDAIGGLNRVVDQKPPKPGADIYLSIDMDIQRAAEEALEGKVGAAVAIDPRTGQLLALVSSPAFEPEAFVRGLEPDEWKALQDPVLRPLFNRAVQGRYAPGSTFKIVTAMAALGEHVIGAHTTFKCTSTFKLGRRVFRCWDWRGHGTTDLYKALVESCDVYFYNVGLKLGIRKLADYSFKCGLGKKTGVDLAHESAGLIPTPEWKVKRFHQKWQGGETLTIAIGQGYTLVTPIQMARLISSVANGGTIYRPQFIDQIVDCSGRVSKSFQKEAQGRLPATSYQLALIKKALLGVVQDKKGTGGRCRIKGLEVAGKTGTAQVIKQAKRRMDEKMAWKYRDHAWFIAYAPAKNPQIAVAVLVEHGGHGGSAAAPIARQIILRWHQIENPRPTLSPARSASLGDGLDHVAKRLERHKGV